MKNLRLLYIFFFCLFSVQSVGEGWRDVSPGDRVNLPRDLYALNEYRIQWWYFTGHLFDVASREFGYELTFFRAAVQKRSYRSKFGEDTIYLAHFAISDVENKKYYYSSDADAGAYGFAGAEMNRLHIWVDSNSLEGSEKKMHIKARAKDMGLDLVLVPEKPAVLNGERGYSRKAEESPLYASLYFSFTDLKTTGIVTVGNASFAVNGKSWFDREISSRGLAKDEAGWDWFSLQLNDGREVMLYNLRKKDGTTDSNSSGTFVYEDGTYRRLAKSDFTVIVLDSYHARITGARYPVKWEIAIPTEHLKLIVTPLIKDQEFPGVDAGETSYWEGTCKIEGDSGGRAYVEMTGYTK